MEKQGTRDTGYRPAAGDALATMRRRAYIIILLVGIAGGVWGWTVNELQGTVSAVTRPIFPTVILTAAAGIWMLRTGRSIRFVEEAIYGIIGGVMLVVLFYSLYLEEGRELSNASLAGLYLWSAFLFIFIFIAHERRQALLRAGLLYLLYVGVSLPALLVPQTAAVPGSELQGWDSLGLSYVSMASTIVVLYFLITMKDDLRRAEIRAERLRLLADTDALTNILNRRGMGKAIDKELARAASTNLPLSLVAFDLDDFKQLNDAYGHDVGDAVLVDVARLISANLRPGDSFGRWGGEEFTILCPQTSSVAAYKIADRLRELLEENESAGLAERVSASFGVGTYRPEDSAESLTRRADVALYRAKEGGKNRTEAVS